MPYTYWTVLISTVAIAGIPPTSGFFSKDEILWKAFSSEHGHPLLWALGFAGAGLTAFYMFRQVFMTFHGECRADHHTQEHLHESPPIMTVPLMILAGLAVIGGLVGIPHALGGSNEFEQWLAPVFHHGHAAAHAEAHRVDATEYLLMLLSVGIAAAGIFLASRMYLTKTVSPERFSELAGGRLYRVIYDKYYVDELYQAVFVDGVLRVTQLCARFDLLVIDGIVNGSARVTTFFSWLNGLFDTYVVDGAVDGIATVTSFVGGRVRRLQTGSINAYLYVIVVAVVGVMIARLL
jgi:NADH-quinone oxidoreductase subunit L